MVTKDIFLALDKLQKPYYRENKNPHVGAASPRRPCLALHRLYPVHPPQTTGKASALVDLMNR
jgi:hypothetical protein